MKAKCSRQQEGHPKGTVFKHTKICHASCSQWKIREDAIDLTFLLIQAMGSLVCLNTCQSHFEQTQLTTPILKLGRSDILIEVAHDH